MTLPKELKGDGLIQLVFKNKTNTIFFSVLVGFFVLFLLYLQYWRG